MRSEKIDERKEGFDWRITYENNREFKDTYVNNYTHLKNVIVGYMSNWQRLNMVVVESVLG